MIRYLLLASLLLNCGIGDAQVKALKPWLMPEIGVQIGATEPSGDLRLQGGIKRQNWYYGLGAAVDFYRFRSYPVYLQVQRVFSFRGTAPFLTASAGYNFKRLRILFQHGLVPGFMNEQEDIMLSWVADLSSK
jgi:hypothetical protein